MRWGIYRDKVTAVFGGGDVAVEDGSSFLEYVKKFIELVRRDELRAAKVLQEEVLAKENVEMVWDSQLVEILGNQKLKKL